MPRRRETAQNQGKAGEIFRGIAWGIFTQIIIILHILIDKVLETVLEWYWKEKKTCSSLRENFFVSKSATEIANLIRNGELTSYQVVKAYIDRMREVNPQINAVADGPFESALAEAQQIDERLEKGEVTAKEFSEKPFLGVPFTTKDSTAVEGALHTLGLISRRTARATEDAECVRLMREAGAVMIATTTVPEVNRWQETRNNVTGITNNPYDLRRTVGGSSGGEAAVISACGSAFGIGTDIGGSIRMPAFYCGIYGHKPTSGLVNMRGCTFRTGKERSTMVVAGPMTRYAKDLLSIFKVLVGPKLTSTLELNVKVNVKKLRYFYCSSIEDLKVARVNGEMMGALRRAINHLDSVGERPCTQITIPHTEMATKLWRYWMRKEPQGFDMLLGNGTQVNGVVELVKKILGQSDFTLASIYSLLDGMLPAGNQAKLEGITRTIISHLKDLLGYDGVLLVPSAPSTAGFHYSALVQVYKFSYWSLFNSLHLPTTQVPLGMDSKALPLGLQIVAAPNCDRLCLAVAEELETALGGWTAPFTAAS
ncbi:fatty-acid amide hydrolase 2 [Phlebotomus argentipes]|uniref:fatty-acid amide hydrolase 2 n=1 Tax=Phlebotomus argentipes TaxID=94469 RepID=UPI002892EDC5|nr:fatty-acid amide hydrolase 2 [Phlebotomus argentipes]